MSNYITFTNAKLGTKYIDYKIRLPKVAMPIRAATRRGKKKYSASAHFYRDYIKQKIDFFEKLEAGLLDPFYIKVYRMHRQ